MGRRIAVRDRIGRPRLDPRTKVLLLIAVNVIMVSGRAEGIALIVRPAVALVPFFLLADEGKGRLALAYLAAFAPAAAIEIFLIPATEGAASLLCIVVSALFARILPSLAMGYYALSTTTVSEFVAAMERLRVPRSIVIPLSVMFRFIPTVVEEAGFVSDSMRMRGIDGRALLKNPVVALEYRVVPLVVCVVKIGEELSAAALTRGLGNPVRRTNVCEIGFRWLDTVLAVAIVAALVCTLFEGA